MPKLPLVYTFGNHMHWVDMQWLWGYHVLPGSIRDMIHFCNETGAKGNINFDGIGYEKLAAENPEALQELKESIAQGQIEPVGGSYGQPYGLFHGGESNVRQRIYGTRAVRRLLGVWPQTFWEEEFDFFPQLPQMLKGVGIDKASLFFQWTWHTPEVPKEEVPIVWWQGQDGTQLLTATRNKLNLHQWPEDMDILFDQLSNEAPESGPTPNAPTPLILQWLELMPSPDWMCRSELLLPKLKQLLRDERFDIQMATLGQYLESQRPPSDPTLPIRPYAMDDVWHGMTLGKNGDFLRRQSRNVESMILTAEAMAATTGLLGRPYAQWDVYPTWELEEVWRELLSAQHHDNDECEGLCGHIGKLSYTRGRALARRISRTTTRNLVQRLGGLTRENSPTETRDGVQTTLRRFVSNHIAVFNPSGWPRKAYESRQTEEPNVVIPPFGWTVVKKLDPTADPVFAPRLESNGVVAELSPSGRNLLSMVSPEFPEGVFAAGPVFKKTLSHDSQNFELVAPEKDAEGQDIPLSKTAGQTFTIRPDGGVEIAVYSRIKRPSGGINSALMAHLNLNFRPIIHVDQPYGITQVNPTQKRPKKYPTGDWMTSPQWFEEVDRPFESYSLVDLIDADNPDRGLLILHDGSPQWLLRDDNQFRCILNAYDPWDEDFFIGETQARFALIPHGPITNAERWKLAQEHLHPINRTTFYSEKPIDFTFSPLSIEAQNVVPTAFYRETRDSGRHTENYAPNDFEADYPYILRLVEFDGHQTQTTLTVQGTVAKATKTNLLGAAEEHLEIETDGNQSKIALNIRPYEIATIYLDIVEGRKQTRDLDAKREIWATVHRVEE